MSQEFRATVIAHAKVAVDRAGRASTEAATQQYLVLPFIQVLGYDALDPDEVVPEAHASFSDKFKNRVDYAIYQGGAPVIAIECKKVGALSEANRGELKGYFNAVATVKLGILTDGLVFQLFTDTGLENMMDDEPFAVINLAEVAEERLGGTELDALLRIRKGVFNPADVGSDARRKIYLGAYIEILDRALAEPDERFVRTLLDMANMEGRRTTRMIEEHTPIIRDAAQTLLDRKILARVGFAERTDLVRVPEGAVADTPAVAAVAPEPAAGGGVVTTQTELRVLDYVRTRLPFLIAGDEELFTRLKNVTSVDHKTVFCVYYKQERKGRLFNFWEGRSPTQYRFEFPMTEGPVYVDTDNLGDIDAHLTAIYRKRVEEMG
ncbi:MAG TPA: type I restriction endonuclease [Longimicrobium sp.]|jgi:hypothetical protein|uniref:type I restriction endonuclease n=1 Tax=Longimicrobium sp. TaxID=2029185 RepID=UPI002EDAA8B1